MPGGDATRFSENIDLARVEDVKAARQLLLQHGRRWPILGAERALLVECLIASAKNDDAAGTAAKRLLIEMENANQRDDERREKHKRLDDGKPTGNVTFRVLPPKVLGQGEQA